MSLVKSIWKQILIGTSVIIALFVGLEVKRRINIREKTKQKRQRLKSMKDEVKSDIQVAVIARGKIDGRVKVNKDEVAKLEEKKNGLKVSYELIKNKEKELEKEEQDISGSIDYLKKKYDV